MYLTRISCLPYGMRHDPKSTIAKLVNTGCHSYAVQILEKLQACAWLALQRQQNAATLDISRIARHVTQDFLQSGAAVRRCHLKRGIQPGHLIALALHRSDSST